MMALALGTSTPDACAVGTLDRVVASIGNTAITRSDVETEHRFENFLEGTPRQEAPDAQQFEQARDRLINQLLLTTEADAEDIRAEDSSAQATQLLKQVRERYPDEQSYRTALATTGLSEEQALRRLERHVRSLRLIDQRLRPNAWVDHSEIEAYYRGTFVPEHSRREGTTVPPLEEVESQIREILVEQKVDQLLAEWLKEIEASRHVRLHSF
jgi:hypothetical protein